MKLCMKFYFKDISLDNIKSAKQKNDVNKSSVSLGIIFYSYSVIGYPATHRTQCQHNFFD